MTGTRSWILLSFFMLLLMGSCSAMAGDFAHYPASLPVLGLMVAGKLVNDRYRIVKWPMEFLVWSAVTLIFFNLVFLHFKPF